MALLKIRDLTKFYGATAALSGVSLTVHAGEMVSIIGPSGAGKSTLLRCINRMIEPTRGSVEFDGKEITTLGRGDLRSARARIGMIFQHYNLVPRLTVIENVLHGRLGHKSSLQGVLGLYTEKEKRKAVQTIERLGLGEQIYQRCDRLSGGQKQRVGIARALVQSPRLILCDEPIASLDPGAAKVIMDELASIRSELGIAILVNLHQVDVALRYADRVVGIRKGSVLFDGEPESLGRKRVYEIYGSEAVELLGDGN